MAADGRGAPELTHSFYTCSVYSPWGYGKPEKSSLCAGEVPGSRKDTYLLALLYEAPRQQELSMHAGGTPKGREKRCVKLS